MWQKRDILRFVSPWHFVISDVRSILRAGVKMSRSGFELYWGLKSWCYGPDLRRIEGWCQDVTVWIFGVLRADVKMSRFGFEEHQNVTLSDVRNWTNGYSQHPLTPTCSNSMETTTFTQFPFDFGFSVIFSIYQSIPVDSAYFCLFTSLELRPGSVAK